MVVAKWMKILFQNEFYVAAQKPAGWHVHPPESGDFPPPRDQILLYVLRNKLKQRVFPVHRLDVGTMGVILFGKSSEAAHLLHQTLLSETTTKQYLAVTRGWLPEHIDIDLELELDSTNEKVPASTQIQRLKTIELPYAIGKKFPTSRYSLINAWPRTGRYHQIRRHLNRISHPIIGDAQHGDSHHNRFFREQLGIAGLCLLAQSLEIVDPWTKLKIKFQAETNEKWDKIHELFEQK